MLTPYNLTTELAEDDVPVMVPGASAATLAGLATALDTGFNAAGFDVVVSGSDGLLVTSRDTNTAFFLRGTVVDGSNARADIDTNPRPVTIRAVVGIFLFRKPNQLLDSLPVLKYFLPGSERGLIGTYFRVDGPLAEPEVDALPLQSLMSGVPSAIKAPFRALRFLFDQMAGNDE